MMTPCVANQYQQTIATIDVLSYGAWRRITSFINHVIQIYVGQKDNVNQWKVTVLEEFLHTVLLYQAVTVRIINVLFLFIYFYYHFTALYNMHYYEITIISLSVLSQC